MKNNSYPTPHDQTASTVVDDQAVIVLADTAEVSILNEIGTRVWQMSDGKHTIDQIIQQIVAEFEVTETVATRDVEEFLRMLEEKKTIVLLDSPQAAS